MIDIPQEPIETRFGPTILHTRKIGIADSEGRPKFLIGISVDITEREWLAGLEQTRRLILETLTSGKPLGATPGYVVSLIERHNPDALCAVLLLDPEGRHLLHGAAPSLPDSYNRAVHGIAFAPQIGHGETAPFSSTRTVVERCDHPPRLASARRSGAASRSASLLERTAARDERRVPGHLRHLSSISGRVKVAKHRPDAGN